MRCERWWCQGWARLSSALIVVVLLIAGLAFWNKTAPNLNNETPSPTSDRSRPVMVALGDSYMSGEGTGHYFAATSTPENTCHRSASAYPYQLAQSLNQRLVFAACSGAKVTDIMETKQYENSPKEVPGAKPQLELLSSSSWHDSISEVETVLVSIGGNDAGFANIVKTCIQRDCVNDWPKWLTSLEKVHDELDRLYDAIADKVTRDTRVLVTTYPSPIADLPCGALGDQLSSTEIRWVNERFLARLNELIRFAATRHQFEIVELEDSLKGERLCEVKYKDAAVNAFALQRVTRASLADVESQIRGSFHPNARGHARMVERLLTAYGAPIPASLPGEPGEGPCPVDLPPDQCGPPGPPPLVPFVPFGERVPSGLGCTGVREELVRYQTISPKEKTIQLAANPGSQVCWRGELRTWEELSVNSSGVVTIPTDAVFKGGAAFIEVWYHEGENEIDKTLLMPPNGYQAPAPSFFSTGLTNSALALLVLGALIGLGLVAFQQIYCLRCSGHRAKKNEAAT